MDEHAVFEIIVSTLGGLYASQLPDLFEQLLSCTISMVNTDFDMCAELFEPCFETRASVF